MPEGPECRHISDCLNQMVVGRKLVQVEILGGRYSRHGSPTGLANFNEALTGQPLEIMSVGCQGKFIYWKFSDGSSMWNTLGMSGQWTKTLDKHCHIKFSFQGDPQLVQTPDGQNRDSLDNCVYFRDIRNFGTLHFNPDPEALRKKLSSLGHDILGPVPLDQDDCLAIFGKRPQWNICKFLMDQSYFSGVGNYIKAEALYLAKINPFRLVKDLEGDALYRLYLATRTVAWESYQAKGASFQTFQDPDRNKGKYSYQFKVYGQKICDGEIVRREKTPDQRTTYWVE